MVLPCSVANCPAITLPSDSISVSCHFEAFAKAKLALRESFKHENFRPGQLSALMPVLHGKDVFVKMATGAGKSLCFFLVPLAVSSQAVAVVISPLTGLMEQQVRSSYVKVAIVCCLLGETTGRCWNSSITCRRK